MSSDKTQVPEQNITITHLCNIHVQKNLKAVKNEKFEQITFDIFSSPEPLGSQGELIGWP